MRRLLPRGPGGVGGARGWGTHPAPQGQTSRLGASRGSPLTQALSRGAAVRFGKGPAGSNIQLTRRSNKNKPRGEIFIFARAYSSM